MHVSHVMWKYVSGTSEDIEGLNQPAQPLSMSDPKSVFREKKKNAISLSSAKCPESGKG